MTWKRLTTRQRLCSLRTSNLWSSSPHHLPIKTWQNGAPAMMAEEGSSASLPRFTAASEDEIFRIAEGPYWRNNHGNARTKHMILTPLRENLGVIREEQGALRSLWAGLTQNKCWTTKMTPLFVSLLHANEARLTADQALLHRFGTLGEKLNYCKVTK